MFVSKVPETTPETESELALFNQLTKAWSQAADTIGSLAFQIRETVPTGRIKATLAKIGMPHSTFYFLAERHVYLSTFPAATRNACKALKVNLAGEATRDVLKSTGLLDAVPAEDAPASEHKAFAADVKAAMNARQPANRASAAERKLEAIKDAVQEYIETVTKGAKDAKLEEARASAVQTIEQAMDEAVRDLQRMWDETQAFKGRAA